MIVVIDGADGVGKSTVINGLFQKFPNSIVLCPKFDSKRYPTFESSLAFEFKKLELAKELGTLYSYVFVDRSIFTTIIYTHVFSNNTRPIEDMTQYLHKYKQLVDFTIFLYAQNSDVVAKRIIKRSHIKKIDPIYENDTKKQKQVNQGFQDMLIFVPTKVLSYTVDHAKPVSIVNKIYNQFI